MIMNSEVYRQFGFDPNSINYFTADGLLSTNFVDFSLENTLFLHSNICQNSTSDNVLQEFFTTGVSTASYIKYDCLDMEAYSKPFISGSDIFYFYFNA